ncbi:MAG: hypothetical protein JWO38_3266 [Gemmataceae bacterium]|nr:hypothetical protein [Gemmataceae bacterium]
MIAWDRINRDVGDLLWRLQRKGVPVRVIVPGTDEVQAKSEEVTPQRRGLPD